LSNELPTLKPTVRITGLKGEFKHKENKIITGGTFRAYSEYRGDKLLGSQNIEVTDLGNND
jgi:hypothetical protein